MKRGNVHRLLLRTAAPQSLAQNCKSLSPSLCYTLSFYNFYCLAPLPRSRGNNLKCYQKVQKKILPTFKQAPTPLCSSSSRLWLRPQWPHPPPKPQYLLWCQLHKCFPWAGINLKCFHHPPPRLDVLSKHVPAALSRLVTKPWPWVCTADVGRDWQEPRCTSRCCLWGSLGIPGPAVK